MLTGLSFRWVRITIFSQSFTCSYMLERMIEHDSLCDEISYEPDYLLPENSV